MKQILIVTQRIDQDHDILGFFYNWIEEFSKHTNCIILANSVGKNTLPGRIKVIDLSRNKRRGRLIKYLHYEWFLLRYLFISDAVFFHMCPEYVLGAHFLPKLFRKPTGLWYVHPKITFSLRIAEKFVDRIFSVTKNSFPFETKKLIITGHGIPIDEFPISDRRSKFPFRILMVGRITKIKHQDLLIDSLNYIDPHVRPGVTFVGTISRKEDEQYLFELKAKIAERKLDVIFAGSVPYKKMSHYYERNHLLINLTDSGSFDKVILEAMAAGMNILTTNSAFLNEIPQKYITSRHPKDIAENIIKLSTASNPAILKSYVEKNHNAKYVIKQIISTLEHVRD